MGTFIGHILPGVGFVLIGLWHLFNTVRNYVEGPWNFQSKPWFPTRWRGQYLKYLELYAIIFGSCTSIAAELFICPAKHQPFADDWSIPSVHLNNFEHSTISLFFAFYGITCLISDILKIHLPRGVLHVMGAFAFSQELMLFHFHSADHMGLEGHYHWLLQLPIIVGLVAAMLEIAAPKVFIVAYVRSVSILFQGFWFIQMGLTLYVSSLVPTGCDIVKEDGTSEVRCGTMSADMRAKALANLYFSWYLVAIILFSIGLYVSMMYHHSSKQLQYEPLLSSLKATTHEEGHQNLKDVEAAQSPRSSQDDGTHSVESDIEMQGMSTISLER
ncbi:unnamed protein product [Calypogeia fissa]